MKENKDLWSDQILNSMAAHNRAEPSKDLFGKIKNSIDEESQVFTINQLRWTSAAAILVLFLNIWSLSQLDLSKQATRDKSFYNSTLIISDFNFYK
jgi:hypothetical protein